MRRFLPCLVITALALPALAEEPSADKPEPKKGISRILGTLDWGASSADVLGVVKAEIDARYADKMKALRDALAIDRLLKEKRKAFGAVQKTLVRFTGERTGYESSLIGREFEQNNSESVLRIDDEAAQRYYFFKDDRLWKIVVAYNTSISRSVPFADFVKKVRGEYGRPGDVKWHTPKGGTKTMRAATWNDELTRLLVEDRSEFFGTFVMRFLMQGVGVEREAARAQVAPPAALDPSTDATLGEVMAEITEESGGGDDDVVDRLTGDSHDVDLVRGRPVYDAPNRGPVESPTFPDEPAKASEKAAAKRDRKSKNRSKRRDRKAGHKNGKKHKKRDAPAASPTQDGLIIY